MKAFRYLTIILSLSAILIIQGCGGGNTDTAGALTLSAATIVATDGIATVSTTVTYAPPAGNTAQGVEVTVTVTDGSGSFSDKHTFTSGSNSYILSFNIAQSPTASIPLRIVASIGDMTASIAAVVPKFVPPLVVAPSVVGFAISDLANAQKTVAISGGIGPYASSSTAPTDISCIVTLNNMNVTLINASSGGVASVASCTVSDSSGLSAIVTVNYFK